MEHDDINSALDLIAPANGRRVDQRWLARSQRAPAAFFAQLHRTLSQVAESGPKCVMGGRIDLYHDLVVRHVGSGRPALRVYDERAPSDRWQTLSFDDLHTRCSTRAASWAAQGVEAGTSLCVLLPFGVECAVSLLTAVRLGACVSLLEPQGPDAMAARLKALAPQHIATEPFFATHLREDLGRLVLAPDDPTARPLAASHTYLAGEPCAALLSPLRRTVEPVVLSCDAVYRGALRDGAVSLALRPGDHLAAPGFHTLQHQPALLFAALIMGAAFIHLRETAVVQDPALLDAFPLRSLGLTAPVRDALLVSPPRRTPRWAHVFKNPEEPTDWEAWHELVEALNLRDTAMSTVLFEAASGGTLLASPRRPGRAWVAELMNVSAAAGRPWALLDFTGSGQPSQANVGVFAPVEGVEQEGDEGEPVAPAYIALGHRRGAEYLYGGTVEPRRSGRVYPADEVLATLADCPFLQAASVVPVTTGGSTLDHRFVLLGFTGAESRQELERLKPQRIAEIERVLEVRLAREYLPDHIELFPCYARTLDGQPDGEVDHDWCRTQYLTGTLFRKLQIQAFERLTALRGAVAQLVTTSPAP